MRGGAWRRGYGLNNGTAHTTFDKFYQLERCRMNSYKKVSVLRCGVENSCAGGDITLMQGLAGGAGGAS